MSGPINSYRDLIAWQKTYHLGKSVYHAAGGPPDAERFGLMSALRRMSYEIAIRIAQGYGLGNTRDYMYFLNQARGGLYRLDTLLLFAVDFHLLDGEKHERLKPELDGSDRVLAELIRSLGG